jgi:hypothetical protein
MSIRNKWMTAGAAVALFLICSLVFYSLFINLPNLKPSQTIWQQFGAGGSNPGLPTLFVSQKQFLCGDLEEVFMGVLPQELNGFSREELAARYPAGDGWQLSFEPRVLRVTRKVEDFCPAHAAYRHLGDYHGMLAVYQGPLGCNSKLLRVETDLPLARFSPEMQIKLQQAMEFSALAGDARERLRSELEFAGEDALNAALENLDEHS